MQQHCATAMPAPDGGTDAGASDAGTPVMCDAGMVVPPPPDAGPDAEADAGTDAEADAGHDASSTSSSTSSSSSTSASSSTGMAGTGGMGTGGAGPGGGGTGNSGNSGGCGCSVADPNLMAGLAPGLLFGVALLMRRRRRA
jgi:hypothetical protein